MKTIYLLLLLFSSINCFCQTTWYAIPTSTQQNWSEVRWTTDPSGQTQVLPDGKTSPESGDNIIILKGSNILFDASDLSLNSLLLQNGSSLDLNQNISPNKLTITTTLEGEGTLSLASENVPTDNFNHKFYSTNGGTIELYGDNDITLNNNERFNNLIINLSSASVTLSSNIEVYNSMNVIEGNVQFDSDTNHSLKISGFLFIDTNGTWRNKVLDTFIHTIEIEGDIEIKGEIDADLVQLSATNKTKAQKIEIKAPTSIYQISISKTATYNIIGFPTYELLTVNTYTASYLTLAAENGLGFNIISGALKLGEFTNYDFSKDSDSDDFIIHSDEFLWLSDRSQLTMTSGNSLIIQGKIIINENAQLDIYQGTNGPNGGIVLSDAGIIQLEDNSHVLAKHLCVSASEENQTGSYIQNNGLAEFFGGGSNDVDPFSLPYANNTFTLTGGNLIIENNDNSNRGFLLGTDDAKNTVTGGDITFRCSEESNSPFVFTSSIKFNNLFIKGVDNTIIESGDQVFKRNGGLSDTIISAKDLIVLNDLILETALDAGANDIIIGRNLTLRKNEVLVGYDWLIFDGSEDSDFYIDYEVEDISFESFNVELYNFRLDKDTDEAKLTFLADPSFIEAEVTEFEPEDGNENKSNLIDFSENFELLKGTLDHGNYSLRFIGENKDLINYGTLGVYNPFGTEGTTKSKAQIKFKPAEINLKTIDSSIFGNVKLFGENTTLTLTSDVKIERATYFSGTIDLQSYTLTIDQLNYSENLTAANNHFQKSVERFGSNTLNNIYNDIPNITKYNNFFVTNGQSSNAGLRLRIDKKRTKYFNYQHPNTTNLDSTVLFPMAIKNGDNFYYTPARVNVSFTDSYNESEGYISVRPVLEELPTSNQDGDKITRLNWRIERDGYIENELDNLPQVNWFFGFSNHFTNGTNPFSGDSFTIDATNKIDFADLITGKILNEDSFIKNQEPIVKSIYERKGFFSSDIYTNALISKESLYDSSTLSNDKIIIAFDKDWSNNASLFPLENAHYSIGTQNRFQGSLGIYVFEQSYIDIEGDAFGGYLGADSEQTNPDGTSGDRMWATKNNWYILNEASNELTPLNTGELPGKNDVVYIGSNLIEQRRTNNGLEDIDNWTFKPVINTTVEVAEIIFGREESKARMNSIWIIENGSVTTGSIKGPGEIEIEISDSHNSEGVIKGDLGEWASYQNSIYKVKNKRDINSLNLTDYLNKVTIADLDPLAIPQLENITEYPIVELHSGALYFDFDIKAYNIDIFYRATLAIKADTEFGNIEASNHIQFKNHGRIVFDYEGDFPKTVTTTSLIAGDSNNADKYNRILVDNTPTTSPISHTLDIKENIIIYECNTFSLYGGDDNSDFNDRQFSNVKLVLTGDKNGEIEYFENIDATPQITTLSLYSVYLNKAFGSKFTFNMPIELLSPANKKSNEKPIYIENGELILDDPKIVIDINSGGEEFILPGNATLSVQNGSTITMTSTTPITSGMALDGTLNIYGGKVLFNQGVNNYITYGSSNNPTNIFIDNDEKGNIAELKVGGQIMRMSSNGVLHYEQKGGIVEIGEQGVNQVDKGIFEITNLGSITLNFTPDNSNSFTIYHDDNLNDVSALLLSPDSATTSYFSNGVAINIKNEGSNALLFESNLNLPDFNVLSGKVKANNGSLTFNKTLSIFDGATFDQGDYDVYFNDNLLNSGTYTTNTGDIYFNGNTGSNQIINSIEDNKMDGFSANNLTISGASTIVLVEELLVNGGHSELNINKLIIEENATLSLVGNGTEDVILYIADSIIINGEISNNNGTVSLVGTTKQFLKSTSGSTINSININNTNGVELISDDGLKTDITFTKRVILSNGNFYINNHHLIIGPNCKYYDINGNNGLNNTEFSENNMVVISGTYNAKGVTKYFLSGQANFIQPIGIEGKYTPLLFSNIAIPNESKEFGVNINLLDFIYSSASTGSNNTLDFTWVLSGVDIDGNKKQIPTDFQTSVKLYYDENDILNAADESQFLTAAHLSEGLWFKGLTSHVAENNNFVNLAFSQNEWATLNKNYIDGYYFIGESSSINENTSYYRSNTTLGDWNNVNSWEKHSSSTLSKTIGEFIYYEYNSGSKPDPTLANGWIPASEYPINGAEVYIMDNTTIQLNEPVNLSLIKIFDGGTFTILETGNSPISSFGNIEGTGIVKYKSTYNSIADWDKFLSVSAGVLYFEIDDNNDVQINLINTGAVRGIQFLATSGFTPNYILNNPLNVGDLGVIIEKDAKLTLEGNKLVTSGDISVKNGGEFYVDGNVIIDGDFNVNLGGKWEAIKSTMFLKGDFNLDNGAITVPPSSFSLAFIGDSPQNVNAEFSLDNPIQTIIINNSYANEKSNNIAAVTLSNSKEFHVSEFIDLQDGLLNSNGNLYFHKTKEIPVPNPKDSWIVGQTKFDWLAPNGIFFPIGTIGDFHPVGIGILEYKDYEPSEITHKNKLGDDEDIIQWTIEYMPNQKEYAAIPLTAPIGVDVVFENGYWKMNPSKLNQSGAYVTTSLLFKNSSVDGVFQSGESSYSDIRLLYSESGSTSTSWSTVHDESPHLVTKSIVTGQTNGIYDYTTINVVQTDTILFSQGKSNRRMMASNTRIGSPEYIVDTDNNDFSFGNAASTDLPVELIYLDINLLENNTAQLIWRTATEINNNGFIIETSTDRRTWSELGFIIGSGNSNTIQEYSFIDAQNHQGIRYYRITQIDYDDTRITYGPLKVVFNETDTSSIKKLTIYPNPSHNQDIFIYPTGFEEFNIILLNNKGVILQEYSNLNNNEKTLFQISTQNIPSGIYFIKLISQQDVIIKKVIIK
ncbi:T9SS type A sorting domain-containing protein [Flammeovirga kamogawensis]|uniref:T9SS type A sorting domain-containing protein n=1 Tax=Flammeovirga kamogawensis TaxID=373891 RepID=A0ABX8GW31_9BACT|nr:T9SS type A sorting domain-containing protein [Flammeovirga kamogawensis]MBB6461250.1 hypothetical protein [Flammeovirga kamogawensis]QWG07809.1 T9SS type A sorting domain-containing protein [Flammeovirga kamogawensis]TRX69615.1 T9SS type A sorting domain-containing protein [Flammeovirga kamogawensis]